MGNSKSAKGKRAILLGCGGLIGLIVMSLFWWSRNPIVFTVPEGIFPEVTARQLDNPEGDAIVIELEFSGEDSDYRVTDFSVSRELAARLGMSTPVGFREELMPLEEDETDTETAEFVAEWNAENLQWVCDLAIAPGEPIVVRIPATDPLAASGPLSISYEQVSTLGGHWSSSTLMVNETTPETTSLSDPSPPPAIIVSTP